MCGRSNPEAVAEASAATFGGRIGALRLARKRITRPALQRPLDPRHQLLRRRRKLCLEMLRRLPHLFSVSHPLLAEHPVPAVRVDGRHQQDHDFLTRLDEGLGVGGRQVVRELHGELRRAGFGRVHIARDHQEELALAERLLDAFRRMAARVGDDFGVAAQRF